MKLKHNEAKLSMLKVFADFNTLRILTVKTYT